MALQVTQKPNGDTYADVEIDWISGHESPGTILRLYAERADSLRVDEESAHENGESPWQLLEGCTYEYNLPTGYSVLQKLDMVIPSKRDESCGRIVTNTYVGTLTLTIKKDGDAVGYAYLEIVSVKHNRSEYRFMLEEITKKCVDLILQESSPVTQKLTYDNEVDETTLYQRFIFVSSLVETEAFEEALVRINASPVKRWETEIKSRPTMAIRRVGRQVMKQMASGSQRINLRESAALYERMHSVPAHVMVEDKRETTDNPENRFVKFVLQSFLDFCFDIKQHTKNADTLRQVDATTDRLKNMLNLPVLRGVRQLDVVSLGNPVLQRKEGYREVLQAYLIFDMAARIVWHGGDDVFQGGKRDVAVLYEYWLFFKLLDVLKDVFGVAFLPVEQLLDTSANGLQLTLKQGKMQVMNGVYKPEGREPLHVQFAYNKTFWGRNVYPKGGSWTEIMRPDYTLTLWPERFGGVDEAELQEMVTYIHFDSKYKIDGFTELFKATTMTEDDVTVEKIEQRAGKYKRADILKMHAYKDAIRRTAGAYILYPGEVSKDFQSFHEILPGIGAFSVKPNESDHCEGLKRFLLDVVDLVENRASQYELQKHYTYKTHKEKPIAVVYRKGIDNPNLVNVVVGTYRAGQLDWIRNNRKYVLRTGPRKGAVKMTAELLSAKYLLLHTLSGVSSELIPITSKAPTIYSYHQLRDQYGYTNRDAHDDDSYLVFTIDENALIEVNLSKYNVKHVNEMYTATMAELWKNKG